LREKAENWGHDNVSPSTEKFLRGEKDSSLRKSPCTVAMISSGIIPGKVWVRTASSTSARHLMLSGRARAAARGCQSDLSRHCEGNNFVRAVPLLGAE